ncbi:DNA base-flipping protein YbcN, partial [Escherichia coli]
KDHITTIQSLRHTSDLDTGEMYVFLCKVEAWAMNIGCHLTIPQSCEFQLLRDKQEA